ncbi:hypothetical protein XENTR_v10020052 [Xenopus tropicalis]|nr:hypothetical protein XENTR_v10020052 [Xenopus tropicalis]
MATFTCEQPTASTRSQLHYGSYDLHIYYIISLVRGQQCPYASLGQQGFGNRTENPKTNSKCATCIFV